MFVQFCRGCPPAKWIMLWDMQQSELISLFRKLFASHSHHISSEFYPSVGQDLSPNTHRAGKIIYYKAAYIYFAETIDLMFPSQLSDAELLKTQCDHTS
jgi:hypothetical protein